MFGIRTNSFLDVSYFVPSHIDIDCITTRKQANI